MSADGTAFRFRHALTREAVLETILPPARGPGRRGAGRLDAAHPRLEGALREVAVDVAVRSGDRHRAGGCSPIRPPVAGLGGPGDRHRRLAAGLHLLEGTRRPVCAGLALVLALALAGEVDEAPRLGERLIARLGGDGSAQADRIDVHLRPGPRRGGRHPVAGQRRRRSREAAGRRGRGRKRQARIAGARRGAGAGRRRRPEARGGSSARPRRCRRQPGGPLPGTGGDRPYPPDARPLARPAPPSSRRSASRKPRSCRSGGCGRCTSSARSTCSTRRHDRLSQARRAAERWGVQHRRRSGPATGRRLRLPGGARTFDRPRPARPVGRRATRHDGDPGEGAAVSSPRQHPRCGRPGEMSALRRGRGWRRTTASSRLRLGRLPWHVRPVPPRPSRPR